MRVCVVIILLLGWRVSTVVAVLIEIFMNVNASREGKLGKLGGTLDGFERVR